MRLPLVAKAEDLARAAPLFGIELPAVGAASGQGTLVRRDDGTFALEALSLALGPEPLAAEAEGTVSGLFAAPELDLALRLEGRSVEPLADWLGVALPELGPFAAAGRFRGRPAAFALADLEVSLPDNRIAGGLEVALGGAVPVLQGSLSVARLDLAALEGEGSAASAQPAPLPLEALHAVEAHLDLATERLALGERVLGPARAMLHVEEGRLALRDIELRVMGGLVEGDAAVATEPAEGLSLPSAAVSLRLAAEEIDIGALLQGGGDRPSELDLDIELDIDSSGATLEELIAQLEGETRVSAGEGSLGDAELDRLVQDLDIFGLLLPSGRRAQPLRVNCFVGEMEIEEGIGETKAMLDTRRMNILGRGTVDLREATVDLRLDPMPKSRKLSAAGVPVEIEGPIAEPKLSVREGDTVGRLLGGFVGGLLVPLNQITALFGERARDACASALKEAGGRAAAGDETSDPPPSDGAAASQRRGG